VNFEELYNSEADPKELRNVLEKQQYKNTLMSLRALAFKEINLSKTNQSSL
jgi:hypothetical protein